LSASDAGARRYDPAVGLALERLGVPRDGVLLLHSAFKTMGQEGHDARIVLQTLVDYMAAGTLMLPAMSWRYVKPSSPVFDEMRTPSNVGILTELFRTEQATARSLHPTHSVCARGELSGDLLGSHHLDETPCSARSPFGLLAEYDAWVVMMGITMDCCTLIHHVEELIAPDLYLRPPAQRETYTCIDRHGRETRVSLRRHVFLPRDYFQVQDALAAAGQLRLARIDNTVCRGFRARDLVRYVGGLLKERPDAIIARPGQRYRMM
jgi:aminoglycoside 3-N-acetyltransferase